MNKLKAGAVAVAAAAAATTAVAAGVLSSNGEPAARQVSAARPAAPAGTAAPMAGPQRGDRTVVERSARFEPRADARSAYTYDPAAVPPGTRIKIRSITVDGDERDRSRVVLAVRGLPKRKHRYDAHVHVGACAADPNRSGGHYMNDPKGGATRANEVWLGFTTRPNGSGRAHAAHRWSFDPSRLPRSVVIHEGEGAAKGDRLACVTVPFAP